MAAATMEFQLVLPDNWLLLDPAGEGRIADEVDALLAQGALHDEAYRAHRGRIEKQLRAVVRSIRREPVAMAAVFISVMNEILPLFAGLTAAVVDGRLEEFRGRPDARVSLEELPGVGPVVRQRFIDTTTDSQTGITVPAAVVQYLIPMPDQRRRLILTFVAPDTEPVLLDAFEDLFAAIAESVSFENAQEQ